EKLQEVATAVFTINYVVDGEVIKSEEGITVVGSEITADATLTIDDQKYYLAEGATTTLTVEADADNILNVNMRKAYVYNYIVKNNVNDDTINGECIEGGSATVPFSKYSIAEDGTVWTKDAINKEYNVTFTPDAYDYVIKLEYTATDIKDGIFFSEGENIDGMTKATGSNANIRCSNAAGGYSDEVVTLYTLPAGTYKVSLGVWGNEGNTFVAKAGETTVLTAETKGWFYEAVSEEFTVETETALTFEGANSSKPLDYVLITGSLKEIVNSVVIDTKDLASEYTIGDTFKLKATVDSDNSSADPQVTWTSSKPAVATVDKAGNVKVVGAGNVRITASYGGKSASCSIKCYPQVGDAKMDGGITIDDAVEITNFVVGKKTAPADWDKDE
ncbi:MAG: Ig-like domain-containing protein, partial [Muribaculaceae bacterium]|nr:Ig-like domain-containing protein [Muribaculaceae bacterium]